MADNAAKLYRRLPGTGYRRLVPAWAIVLLFFVIGIFALLLRGRRVQLWLGESHLLQVEWDGYREYYKRFRYADVQSLVIRRTPDGMIASIVLALPVLIFTMLALVAPDTAGRVTLFAIAGVFGLFLAINAAYGPTCQCQLRTAVQLEELPSLTRLRHVRAALEHLQPLITAAQGNLSREEMLAYLSSSPDMMVSEGALPPAAAGAGQSAPPGG